MHDLTKLKPGQKIRFLYPNGEEADIPDIVCTIDTATGHYTGYKVEDQEPVFKDGKPVMVRGSVKGPVLIHYIGEGRFTEDALTPDS